MNLASQTDRAGEPPAAAGRAGVAAFVESLRISHWTKNLFVLVALLFSDRRGEPGAWLLAVAAALAFGLVSSAVYLVNDIVDRHSDRLNPAKAGRPVASGRLSVAGAAAGAVFVLLCGAAVVAAIVLAVRTYYPLDALDGLGLPVWIGIYLLMNLGYNLGLKSRPIVDVVIVALGFVLRAMAGAAAVAVVISPWLVVCTFMLCLFIALAKRRSELVELGEVGAGKARRVHQFYTLTNLEHMLAVSAGLAIVTYTLYCMAERTIHHVGSANLIWTVPLVVYGMFRYYCLTLASGSQDAAKVLLRDKMLWLVGLLWVICVVIVLKWGRSEILRGILQ